MTRICGWCKRSLGEKEPLENKAVTHGICIDCATQLKHEARATRGRTSVNTQGDEGERETDYFEDYRRDRA